MPITTRRPRRHTPRSNSGPFAPALRRAALSAVLAWACAPAASARRATGKSLRAPRSESVRPGLDLAEAGRVRQPSNVVLSPAGDRVAFVLGDSLLVVTTRAAGPAPGARVVATGVAGEASAPVPFLAWAPDGRRLLYRSGATDGVPMVATVDGAALGGTPPRPLLPDSVARGLATFQNFLAGGPAWSPDGRRVAFLAARRADPAFTLQVYVADVASGRVERWTPEGRARFGVAWSPDGRWLAYASGAIASGPGVPPATVELLDARPSAPGGIPAGAARPPVAVVTDSAPLLRDVRWSPDGRFLLAQDRTRRTVVVRLGGGGDGGVPRVERVAHALPRRAYAGWLVDTAGGLALLTAVPDGMSARLAAVAFPSGRVTRLTGPDTLATPVGTATAGGRTVAAYRLEAGALPSDVWAAEVAPGLTVRLRGARNVTRANPWLDADRLPRTRVVRRASGDTARRDTLQAQLFEPRGARPPAGWPLVVVPYGGYRNEFPRSEYFLDRGLLPLVAAGYAVVRPNTRGVSGDDRDAGQYGRPQLEDTGRLLDALGAEGTVDPRRVAVAGHSHGGAMAYYYLTHSRRFCAVVAVNGRADWVLQGSRPDGDGVLPDRLGGTPAEKPDVYRAFSPAANARSASAPLLAVAGGKDTQILPANVSIMADSMRAAGRAVETLVFPDEGHLLLDEANVRRFWDRAFATLTAGCPAR